MEIGKNIASLLDKLPPTVELVAVSKTKSNEEILEAYNAGQRKFGENKIQDMTRKYEILPKDIQWHMIGHVQSNKVKYMAPYVSLIHGVDSLKLLKEINKQAKKITVLLIVFFKYTLLRRKVNMDFLSKNLSKLLKLPKNSHTSESKD